MKARKKTITLITGTGQGIGKYLAKYYIEKGFQVIGCSRRSTGFQARNYKHYCLDISDESMVSAMFAEICKEYNRLDVLINNASVHSINYALLTPLEAVHDVFKINVEGTFLISREAAKLMKKNSYGRILNISTIAVALCNIGTSIYGSSKAAIDQFARVLARELVSFGITVNTLGLSVVRDTGMAETLSKDAIASALNQTIMKSPLDLRDVAHAVDFFISEHSTMVTGQTLYLGGL